MVIGAPDGEPSASVPGEAGRPPAQHARQPTSRGDAGQRSRGGGARRPSEPSVGTRRHRSTRRPSNGAGSTYVSPLRSPKYSSRRRSTHLGSLRHRRPRRQVGAGEPPVRCTQPVGVLDDHVQDAGDGAAERHPPGGRRTDGRARRHGVLEPRLPGHHVHDGPRKASVTGALTGGSRQLAANSGASAGDEQRHGYLPEAHRTGTKSGTTSSRRRAAPRAGQATPAAVRRARR